MVIKWKNKYYNMKGLSQKVEQYLQKGPCLERHRGIVELKIFGLIGMDVLGVLDTLVIDYHRRELQIRSVTR